MCATNIYETRTSRSYNALSGETFGIFNTENILGVMCGYCLDAPEQIPAGSIKDYGKKERHILQSIISRTIEEVIITKEREILAQRLIAELLQSLDKPQSTT